MPLGWTSCSPRTAVVTDFATAIPAAPEPREKGHRRRRWRRRLRRVLGWTAAAYVLAAFTLTHVDLPTSAAAGVPHADKLVHAAIFVGLAVLTAGWRVTRFDPLPKARRVAFVLCLIYAAADELTQLLTANRQADPWDFAADTAGTLLGLALAGPLLRWFRRHG